MTAVHGVTGILGSLGLGLLATSSVNPGGPDGAFYGHPAQLGYQAVGVLAAVLLSALFTFLILQLLRLTLGLRHEADSGPPSSLDARDHGEAAYASEAPLATPGAKAPLGEAQRGKCC